MFNTRGDPCSEFVYINKVGKLLPINFHFVSVVNIANYY